MNLVQELRQRGLRLQDEDTVDSTNRIAAEAARQGAGAGLVVRARAQTAGRGRQGRSWLAAPGDALLVSLLRRPDLPIEHASRVTLAVGLAVSELALEFSGAHAWVKWPNDVLIGNKKLAGILCEWTGGALIIGVGVNLRTDRLPEDLRVRAAGLGDVDGDAVLLALIDRVIGLERALTGGQWDDVRGRCELAMAPLWGRTVSVDGAPARAVRLDSDGALLIQRAAAGAPERVLAADIHLGTEAAACCS